jgi:hypothetical protein
MENGSSAFGITDDCASGSTLPWLCFGQVYRLLHCSELAAMCLQYLGHCN